MLTPSQLQHCDGSVEELGRKDGVGCKSESCLSQGPSAITSFAWRNCHTVSATLSSVHGRSFNEGGGWPSFVLQSTHLTHLAVKAKKTKSKVENVEAIEDVAGTA
jgi:hypothetical protein